MWGYPTPEGFGLGPETWGQWFMFGIALNFNQVQAAFASFFQNGDGITAALGLVFALGVVGVILSALRSGLGSKS